MEIENWFKLKRYPHIDLPITMKDYLWVRDYVNNIDKIRTHSFLPLIHKSIVQRKFRADHSTTIKNPSGKRPRKIGTPKIRHIFYSSHLDSLIFSKYNELLNNAYEKYIKKKEFENSIVAYRKIPKSENSKYNKCNIDFAKTSFEFILNNNPKKLTAIVADITSFFDNLNHKILKRHWAEILDMKLLPNDHYNIYKALTNIKYVESEQLFKSYGNTMLVMKGVSNSTNKKEIKRKKINSSKFFKEKNAIAYCNKNDFLRNNLNLIISKNNTKGIPQGSPISATLANIYMLDFDKNLCSFISEINGFYQRYSDDIIIICEQKFEEDVLTYLRKSVTDIVDLEIEPSKTKIFRFEYFSEGYKCYEFNEISKSLNFNRNLEYLGFRFDGQKVLIKSSGFSKFYRGMKRSFKKSTSLALHSKNPDKSIFKSKLYKRFTYIGATRKLIFRPSKNNKKIYIKTHSYYWGNYLSYIYKADDTMSSINKGPHIKKQGKKIWKKFHNLMQFHQNRLNQQPKEKK